MAITILVESEARIGSDLRWPLRVAALSERDVILIVPTGQEQRDIDLATTDPGDLGERLRAVLDDELGEGSWAPASVPLDDDNMRRVALRLVPMKKAVATGLSSCRQHGRDLMIVVAPVKVLVADEDWAKMGHELESRCLCPIVTVSPGPPREGGDLVASVTGGRHAHAAIRLAAHLGERDSRQLACVEMQPDIGPDSQQVGRRILDRHLRNALDELTPRIRRMVEIGSDPAKAINRMCEAGEVDAVFVGLSRIDARAGRAGTLPLRLSRASSQPTIIGVCNPVPLKGRLQRRVMSALQLFVPQLERDDRTGLVERIQSTSRWNFDFLLLMGMATTIATYGLIDNSVAVIIGAMLIAPLMTPLLGLGLSIAQGNPQLARITLKASGLGFLTSFLVAFVVGIGSPQFHESTSEMAARDLPQLLDLFVAFGGGLAAAYASGRPGLLAALPGVAIAAALVPPIATAGLAVSVGSYELALGATMLFVANMVTIVLAAALTFWAVGIRVVGGPTRITRFTTAVVVLSAVAFSIGLALAPPRLAPPQELVEAIENSLGEDTRVRDIRLKKEQGKWVVQIDLGGMEPPDKSMQWLLLRNAKEHLGPLAGVRLTYRYEVVMR